MLGIGARSRRGRASSPLAGLLLLPLALATGGEAPAPSTDGSPEDGAAREAVAAVVRPTGIQLAGGTTTLAQAVSQLAAGGNATMLARDADPGLSAVLQPLSGTYWQAVLAVCAAYDLCIAALPGVGYLGPNASEPNVGFARFEVPVQTGPVILHRRAASEPRLLADAQGPLLVVVDTLQLNQTRPGNAGDALARWAELSLRLLIEPGISAERIAQARLALKVISVPSSQELPLQVLDPAELAGPTAERPAGSINLALPDVPACAGLHLAGILTVPVGTAATLAGTLRLGTAQQLVHGQERIGVRLIDGESAIREKRRGPGLLLTYPQSALLADPLVHVTVEGKELAVESVERNPQADDNELFLQFAAEPSVQEHRIEISASRRCGDAELPLASTFDFGALPVGEVPPDQGSGQPRATMLSWPAATVTLQQAIERLRASGNGVLLELGTDETRRGELPAFNGTFWEGVLALCRAYQLTVLASDGPAGAMQADEEPLPGMPRCMVPCDCGTVCLGHQRSGRPPLASMAACGPLLAMVTGSQSVLTRGRQGVERRLNLNCRLRLEPRLGDVRFSSLATWYADAEAAGRSLPVRCALQDRPHGRDADDGDPILSAIPFAKAKDAAPWMLVIGDLPPGPTHFDLGALLVGDLVRPLRAAIALSPGHRQALRMGNHDLLVTFLDRAQASALGLGDTAIMVEDADGFAKELKIELRTRQGERLKPISSDASPQHPLECVLVYEGLAHADYQLELSANVAVAHLIRAITIAVDVP